MATPPLYTPQKTATGLSSSIKTAGASHKAQKIAPQKNLTRASLVDLTPIFRNYKPSENPHPTRRDMGEDILEGFLKKGAGLVLFFILAGPVKAGSVLPLFPKYLPNTFSKEKKQAFSKIKNPRFPGMQKFKLLAESPKVPIPKPDSMTTPPEKLIKTPRSSSSMPDTSRNSLVLFQWLNEQYASFQWAYGFLQEDNQYAPDLLKEKITEKFKNDTLLYLNFHQNIIQFPYVLKWGIRGSVGRTRNADFERSSFFPLSVSVITSLQIFKRQIIVPFFELGYSVWNVNFSDFSKWFPFYGAGMLISFSLFKNSLYHTLFDEYGIRDTGIIVELRNNASPLDFPEKDRGYFLRSLHLGVYLQF